MMSPQGGYQCNRCREPISILDLTHAELEPTRLTFCSVECRCEYQISNGFVRVDNAHTLKGARPRVEPTAPRLKRNDTDEFRREDVQPARWKTALWVTLAMCVAFKLATVYLQWQRGEGITFAGWVVVKPR